ncbi:TolC family protein [Mucilaginibacter pedocola]|uniref:Transporter n=1 Tax=Mucilaginibacter pedocola TaxID=1792845 RepID=A0A1S9P9V6_9SPHI|nr:TolC family protein [Mucilaginibacter pedocola]OOQ57368.1 hypothetical protein BC343_14800 [Mucilaginibacter pedocola]
MKKFWAICACMWAICINPAFAEPLTLKTAINLSLEQSPTIQGAEATVLAAKGERRQAGSLPNPVLGVDVENVGGSGVYNGADSAEITFGVSQLIQIGGKRSARIAIAESGQDIAAYDRLATRFDLMRDVKVAFANAVAAQEQAVIAQQQVELAKDVLATVTKRVDAAAEPVIQKNKARVSLANAQVAYERAKRQKEAAVKSLATYWAGMPMTSQLSAKEFYKIVEPKLAGNIEDILLATVDHKRQAAAVNQAKSQVDLEKANAIPDPSFSVGVRDLRQNNDQALVAGLSIPLPVFNMNGGNIAKARQLAVKADMDRQGWLLGKQDSFNEYAQGLESAYVTASTIKNNILPEAQEAFAQAKRGYNAGKFAYLEVLDAQRTLAETKLSYVQALQQYQINAAQIERLTAQADGMQPEKKNAE